MKSLTRYIFTIVLAFSFTAIIIAQEKSEDKFKKGVTLFSSGNYKDALSAWTDLYNTGYRSANLSYNIGNAYFKLNNIPSAILFYERSYVLKPSDENVNYNMQIARTLIVDRFQEIPELFFVRWYHYVSLIFSTNTWARISIFSFVMSLLFLSLYLYSSKYSHKVTGFLATFSFIAITILSLAFSITNKSLVYDSHKAIIMSPVISGKSSPSASGTDLFVLHEGTKVSIGDKVGDWYEIRLSDGNKGWVQGSNLSVI